VKDQVVVQESESKASPGPATKAYREEIALQNKVQKIIKDKNIELKQSDIQLDLIKEKYLKANKNIPKGSIQFEKKSTNPSRSYKNFYH
ncbi:32280_t:CDS:1, partial [Gigaspora margarita]